MADSSFDIVSKIDHMEVDNAFNQCDRELATRFDFKNTGTKIEKTAEKIMIESDTEERAKAALEVLKEKLIKRNVLALGMNIQKNIIYSLGRFE